MSFLYFWRNKLNDTLVQNLSLPVAFSIKYDAQCDASIYHSLYHPNYRAYREKEQKTGDWYSHLRLSLRIWFLSFLGNTASNRTHFDPQRVLQFTRARPATKAQSQLNRSTSDIRTKRNLCSECSRISISSK